LSPTFTLTTVTRPTAENESRASLLGTITAEADTGFPSFDWFVFDGVLPLSSVIVGMGVGADLEAQADGTSAITMMKSKNIFLILAVLGLR
jgi:hypothetical protein